MNYQNNRKWYKSNPYIGVETPLDDQKILGWCANSSYRFFGTYYFKDTVNTEKIKKIFKKSNFKFSKKMRIDRKD